MAKEAAAEGKFQQAIDLQSRAIELIEGIEVKYRREPRVEKFLRDALYDRAYLRRCSESNGDYPPEARQIALAAMQKDDYRRSFAIPRSSKEESARRFLAAGNLCLDQGLALQYLTKAETCFLRIKKQGQLRDWAAYARCLLCLGRALLRSGDPEGLDRLGECLKTTDDPLVELEACMLMADHQTGEARISHLRQACHIAAECLPGEPEREQRVTRHWARALSALCEEPRGPEYEQLLELCEHGDPSVLRLAFNKFEGLCLNGSAGEEMFADWESLVDGHDQRARLEVCRARFRLAQGDFNGARMAANIGFALVESRELLEELNELRHVS